MWSKKHLSPVSQQTRYREENEDIKTYYWGPNYITNVVFRGRHQNLVQMVIIT